MRFRFVLLATAIFSLFVLTTHQTFIGDDWSWLSLARNNPHFGWMEPYPFARIPVAILYLDVVLKSGVLEMFPRAFLIVFFAVYAFAFVTLFEDLMERSGPKPVAAMMAAGLVFVFWPNNYEVHLWHLESTHALGVLCVAYAFRCKNRAAEILLVILAFLTYETFVFLYVGMSALHFLIDYPARAKESWNQVKRQVQVCVVALIVTAAVKYELQGMMNHGGFAVLERRPMVLFTNVKSAVKMIWSLHFYKTNWVFSPICLIAMGILAWRAWKTGRLSKNQILLMMAVPTLLSLPLIFLTYSAQRAYFGPQILQALVFAYFSYLSLGSVAPQGLTARALAPLVLLAVLFAGQWGIALYVKNRNYEYLASAGRAAAEQFEKCAAPCEVTLPSPFVGVRDDYLALTGAEFYLRIAQMRFPGKEIHITLK